MARVKVILSNRFLRRAYWLMKAEVKFKRKAFNCSGRGGGLHVYSRVIVNDYGIAVVKLYFIHESTQYEE